MVPPEPLSSQERSIIQVFESAASAVVNVFDATLPLGGKPALSVDTPGGQRHRWAQAYLIPPLVSIVQDAYNLDVAAQVCLPGSRLQSRWLDREAAAGFIWDDQGHIVTNYHVIGRCRTFSSARSAAG